MEPVTETITPAPAPPSSAPVPAAEPAAPVAAEPTAVEKALGDKDFPAFQKARAKEREAGLAPVTPNDPPPAPTPAPTEPRKISKEQEHRNDAIRSAVERTTADLRAEVASLKAQLEQQAKPRPERMTAPVVEDPEPDPSDTKKYPDGQFDKQFIKDLGAWSGRQAYREQDSQRQALTARDAKVQSFRDRAATSREKVQAAVKADPTFVDKIDPRLKDLRPSVDVPPGEPITFGNILADWICESDFPVEVLTHLSDPNETARLMALAPMAFLREQGRIEASFKNAADTPAPAPAPAPPIKTLTDNPEPPASLGKRPTDAVDPIEAGVRSGDFAAYQRAKRQAGITHWAG